MFVCVRAYVCAGVFWGYVVWVGLCQWSTGASVGMLAEHLVWSGWGVRIHLGE